MISKEDLKYKAPGQFEESRFEKIHNITFSDSNLAEVLVAEEIADLINSKKENPCVLGLATGSSPIGVYQELVKLYKQKKVSFKNVVTFNLDEYYPIDKEDSQSYHSFMHQHLFNHVDIKPENIHIPSGEVEKDKIHEFCLSYEKKIEAYGGLDFQLLGIGRTGHIGFNEPGSHENSTTRIVSLDPITREDAAQSFNGMNNVPHKAITMGIKSILNSKRIILLAWGHKKAYVTAKAIEGKITNRYPASFLQKHKNCTFILDNESCSELTKINTPWIVKDCEWTESLKKKAIVWLSKLAKKPILKLTQRDYNENGLSELLHIYQGNSYELNIWMYNQLQRTITGWPGGKFNYDDKYRPERSEPQQKRSIIFSPHPDDDVISMGGTFARLISQQHEVHVAYQTSGNIAVNDAEVVKYLEVYLDSLIDTDDKRKEILLLRNKLLNKTLTKKENKQILKIRGNIRKSECLGAGRFLELPTENLHFLNLPFYETGEIIKNNKSQVDIDITKSLIEEIKPHQIFAAGDLADPHGTHKICLDILFQALDELKGSECLSNCYVWLYRGAWQEWNIEDIEMAVPMSPSQVVQKRNAILFHQSQKDNVMFQGEDNREFWVRAEERNQETAIRYNQLGLTEYQAIEAFKRYDFNK